MPIPMTGSFVAFAIAFGVAALVTPVVRRLAVRWNVVDRPDDFRKVHEGEIPRLGGVAVFAAFVAPVAVYLALGSGTPLGEVPLGQCGLVGLLLGAAVALGLGVFDDVLDLRARWKLIFQAVAATVAYIGGYRITAISNPFGDPFVFGVLSYPITVLWFLACMNAINLLDGLDGLAAGAALFASITLFVVSVVSKQAISMFFMACLSGSVLGFLLYNFYPAKIFLGDSGSMLLGYLIAALALVEGTRKAETALALLVPLIALGLPLFDTALAVLRRWSRRLPLSGADRQHIHHVLISLGLSHRKAVLILYGACLGLGGIAYFIAVGRNEVTLILISTLLIVAFVSARMFWGVRFQEVLGRVSEDFGRMGRAKDAKVAAQRVIARLPACEDAEAVWRECTRAFSGLHLDFARLELSRGAAGDGPRVFAWPSDADPAADPAASAATVWTARLSLRNGEKVLGEIEVSKACDVGTLLPDAPELLERLRREMAAQLDRLAAGPREGAGEETEASSQQAHPSSTVGHQLP